MKDNVALWKETDLFRGLTHEQIGKILEISRPVSFPAGSVIMKEGEIGDAMYLMMTGTVEVVKRLILGDFEDEREPADGKVFTRLTARDHAVFGEIVLLEAQKRTATVRAVTDCTLYEIRKDDFLALAEGDCALGYRLLLNLGRIVSSRLRKSDEETVKLTTALSIILKEL